MPYEQLKKHYNFPFELRPYQVAEFARLAVCSRMALYWDPGVGKTAGAAHWALHRSLNGGSPQWIVLAPPILLDQWKAFLKSIRRADTGESLSVRIYRGSPKHRKTIPLNAMFTLMSYGVFKSDFELLFDYFEHKDVGLIPDEAHAIKNIESQTHKAVKFFCEGRELAMLTGTPITTPMDSYAYIRLLAPGVYRNLRQFTQLHVAKVDMRDKPKEWQNLDLLAENMRINTSKLVLSEVRPDMPPVQITPVQYRLAPAHQAFYDRVANERLVELENGGEVNAISASALYSTLQQLVLNGPEFAMDPDMSVAGLELAEQVLDEIGPHGKLVVVANFVRSNQMLQQALSKYGAVAIYGDVTSPKLRAEALQRFKEAPGCRVIILQPKSGGFGIDGLQHVCADMLMLEAPSTSPPFTQVLKRLNRDGQTKSVNCRIAIAMGTVQHHMFQNLIQNDDTINAVQPSPEQLRKVIFGNRQDIPGRPREPRSPDQLHGRGVKGGVPGVQVS
jgi:hypothetical protein